MSNKHRTVSRHPFVTALTDSSAFYGGLLSLIEPRHRLQFMVTLKLLSACANQEFHLKNLAYTHELDLSHLCKFTDKSLANLFRDYPRTRSLAFFVHSLGRSGISLQAINRCINTVIVEKFCELRSLTLHDKSATDADLEIFTKNCPELRQLSVFHSTITDRGVAALAGNCLNLRALTLTGNARITDAGLKNLYFHCLSLEKLDLSSWAQMQGECLQGLPGNWSQLKELYLSYCEGVTDLGLKAIVEHCPELQLLDLKECLGLTEVGFIAIARHCRKLQSLDLLACEGLTDRALSAIAIHCLELQSLDVSTCSNITDRGIRSLVSDCKNIHSLTIRSLADDITSEGLLAIALYCQKLRSFEFSFFHGINTFLIAQALRLNQNLQCVKLTSRESVTDDDLNELATDFAGINIVELDLDFTNEEITDATLGRLSETFPGISHF